MPVSVNKLRFLAVCASVAPAVASAQSLAANAADAADREVLPEFAVVETRLGRDARLSPGNVVLDTAFAPGLNVAEVPRSITVVTPRAMEVFGIRSFADLEKAGPGTALINYFGIAGTPIIRGTEAGVYFNGMLRAYQRNEMPVSFGSLERLDVMRGAAPAQFTPTPVGGFVNFVPRAPRFDHAHQSAQVTVGSSGLWAVDADLGGTTPDGRAAWRITASVQRAGTFYDHVRDDHDSFYATAAFRPRHGLVVTAGAEFYRYRSNENLGWNRVTPELLTRGAYVLGEPAALTAPAWDGNVARTLLEFPYSSFVNPRLHSLAVPGEVARAQIPAHLRALMINLNDSAQVAALYALRPEAELPAFLQPNPAAADYAAQLSLYQSRRATAQATLDLVPKNTQDAFVYTPAYFSAGGTALTTTINRSTALADPADFADAVDFLAFLDVEDSHNPDRTWRNQFFVEHLATDKDSSYGYATESRQTVVENKFTAVAELSDWRSRLTAGLDLRFVDALVRQDYAAEVFGRRDLSASAISANSRISAGATLAPDGLNLWSPAAGANIQSRTGQGGLFASLQTDWNAVLTSHLNVRAEGIAYSTRVPDGIDRADAALRARYARHAQTGFILAGFQPVVKLTPSLRAYASVQQSTAVDFGPAGTIYGRANFSRARHYEAGLKHAVGTAFYAALSAYTWEQSNYNARDAQAEPVAGHGFEVEATWEPNRWIALQGSFSNQRQHYRGTTLGFGALPRTEKDWALTGGLFSAAGGRTFTANPNFIYPGYPEQLARLGVLGTIAEGWSLSFGATWRDAHWLNFDRTLRISDAIICDAGVFYERADWAVRLTAENLFNTNYFIGSAPIFSANALATPGPSLAWRLSCRRSF